MGVNASINIEEVIGKTVGRRRSVRDPLAVVPGAIAASEQWRAAFGGVGIRKGVYRFKSHEEANASQLERLIHSCSK